MDRPANFPFYYPGVNKVVNLKIMGREREASAMILRSLKLCIYVIILGSLDVLPTTMRGKQLDECSKIVPSKPLSCAT